jgi:hypothetical protein
MKEPAVMISSDGGVLLGVPFHNFCYGLVGVAYFLESLLQVVCCLNIHWLHLKTVSLNLYLSFYSEIGICHKLSLNALKTGIHVNLDP